jgi:hypothetical protein
LRRYVGVETALMSQERLDPEAWQGGIGGRPVTLILDRLPDFSLDSYAQLVASLCGAGYRFASIGSMRSAEPRRAAYLRHDVDFHLLHVDRMAELEADLAVSATYYVALTQPYNVLSWENVAILRRVVALGHELGLHYDLTCYPTEPDAALERLAWEVSVLERAGATTVRSICMHQPHTGHENVFATSDRWLNPHDPRLEGGLLYVSDSCRAWRDESLLRCLGSNPPNRVMLNTHPELWLDGTITGRERYLKDVVIGNAVGQTERYIDESVRVWRRHSGARAHDVRVAPAREST